MRHTHFTVHLSLNKIAAAHRLNDSLRRRGVDWEYG